MKRNLIALALVLFLGSVLFASAQTTSRREVTGSRLIISRYGTLLDVVDAKGNSRFGKLRLDGYRLTYKSKGKMRSAFAIGAKNIRGLRPEEFKSDGKFTSVSVTTSDRALKITSYFGLDEATNKLTIRRIFQNISGQTVETLVTTNYLDPKLIASSATQQLALQQAQGQILTAGDPNECAPVPPHECPPDLPPCIVNCPNPGPLPTLSTDITQLGRQFTLTWNPRSLNQVAVGTTDRYANRSDQIIKVDLKR